MKIENGWRDFPALSDLLFDRQLSLEWTGPTSVSDNMFDRVHRLLKIYAKVCDSEAEIGPLLTPPDGRWIHEDLMHLSAALASTSEAFATASKEMTKLAHTGKR